MNIETLREYCLSKPGVTEGFPFDEDALVFKVMGKMFALMPDRLSEGGHPTINLKCDPEFALILRQTYAAVEPGYHMNKRHWNTIHIDGTIPDDEIRDMIDQSYELVTSHLPKKLQLKLQHLHGN